MASIGAITVDLEFGTAHLFPAIDKANEGFRSIGNSAGSSMAAASGTGGSPVPYRLAAPP